jgi:hypothetical protein
MVSKTKKRPRLTDAERHKRFLDMAREVEASEDPKDFDKAFSEVVKPSASDKTKRHAG